MNSKSSIVTSAADGCGKPQHALAVGRLVRSHRESHKEFSMFKSHSLLLAACGGSLLALSCGSFASASVIYQDNFARTGNLAGTTPAPTDTNSVKWANNISGMTATTNGTELILAQASGQYGVGNGYLTYSPPSSGTITLSAGLISGAVTGTGSGGWGMLGFESSTSLYNPSASGPNITLPAGANYVIASPAGQNGTGTDYSTITGFTAGSTTVLTISYDISTETANWYAQTGSNPQQLLYTYDYATHSVAAPVIEAVEVGMWTTPVNATPEVIDVQNFTLTAVPEPATLGLVMAGGLGLLLLKRRQA
jgi:hypothetical protein